MIIQKKIVIGNGRLYSYRVEVRIFYNTVNSNPIYLIIVLKLLKLNTT